MCCPGREGPAGCSGYYQPCTNSPLPLPPTVPTGSKEGDQCCSVYFSSKMTFQLFLSIKVQLSVKLNEKKGCPDENLRPRCRTARAACSARSLHSQSEETVLNFFFQIRSLSAAKCKDRQGSPPEEKKENLRRQLTRFLGEFLSPSPLLGLQRV